MGKLREESIRVISIPGFGRDIDMFGDAYRLWFILKTIWHEKPHTFHINSAKMGGAGIFVGRLLGVPRIIFTGHGWAFSETWRPAWQKTLIKFFSWMTVVSTHFTICVSEKTRQDITHWPFIKNKLVVIRNGINTFDQKPRNESRQKLVPNIGNNTLLVGSTSELHKIKGLDVLLTAWKKFVDRNKAHLVLIGTGDEKNRLESMVQKLGIESSVTLTGYVDEARSHLSALDIFVMPSRSENLPYSILEAGLARLPVVASRVGGIPEIIETGHNGILVDKEDPEALSSSLLLLSEDTGLRERLGRALEETVRSKFSVEKMAHDTMSLYER